MGLLDFLKRKPRVPPEDEGPSPDYVFAHYALRQIALSDPLHLLAVAASPEAKPFFEHVLKLVADQCGRRASFDAASLKIHATRVNDYACAVIELPEPREVAEAFMVALVLPIETSADKPPKIDEAQARYFTLEKGFALSNEPRTVLAEWDAQRHSNYGDGPAPTVDEFVAALGGHL
jgi:hypothetical protein